MKHMQREVAWYRCYIATFDLILIGFILHWEGMLRSLKLRLERGGLRALFV